MPGDGPVTRPADDRRHGQTGESVPGHDVAAPPATGPVNSGARSGGVAPHGRHAAEASTSLAAALATRLPSGAPHTPGAAGVPAAVDRALDTPADPIEPGTRSEMEGRFAQDFSAVRLHAHPDAAAPAHALGARAFTVGTDIVLPGYRAGSAADSRLLAHELAHVVQQSDARSRGDLPTVLEPSGSPAEETARAVAGGADAGLLTSTGPRPLLQREPLDTGHEGVVTSAQNQPSTALQGITAISWVERHQVTLSRRVVELLRLTPFDLSPYQARWSGTGQESFCTALGAGLLAPVSLWWSLARVLGTDSLTRAIDAGRDSYPALYGTVNWQPGVPAEVVSRLAVRIQESMTRVVNVLAAYELNRINAAGKPAVTAAAAPGGTPSVPPPEPLAAGAFPHPIDQHVLLALSGNVTFDWTRWLTLLATPEAWDPQRRLRRVRFVFETAHGTRSWLRAIDPPDATLAEVANELYGDPSRAHRLVNAHPLYGFPQTDVGGGYSTYFYLPAPGFRPEHNLAYQNALRTMPVTPVYRDPISPMEEILSGPLAEEVALRAAAQIGGTSGVSASVIRQRMTLINDRFAQILGIAPALGHPPGDPSHVIVLGPNRMTREPYVSPAERAWGDRLRFAASRHRKRLERLLASPDEHDVLIWDAQSAGQLEILNSVHAGLSVAAALAIDYRDQPRIHDVIMDVASRYVAAAEISDAYGPAHAQLMAADRQSRLFPVTAMELVLADLRAAIDASRASKWDATANDERYGLRELDRTELDLRERLARIRPILLTSPDLAKEELQNISRQLLDLQTGVGLSGNLDAIDSVLRALRDSLTFSGEFRSLFGHYGNDKIEDAINGALKLHQEWHGIYTIWVQDKATGRRLLNEKAKSKEWRVWYTDMRVLITDQQQADRWTTFGLMVGIALITAGIGAYVGAAAGAAWGSTAGFFAATAAEAVSFTSMSYLVLEKDPSVSGFFKQLGVNLLTFGALRSVSLGYRALIGVSKAATPIGKMGEIAVSFVSLNALALAQASYEKRSRTGQPLTQEEVVHVSLENLAFVGAMTLGTFLLRSPLIKLTLAGELTGANYRVGRAAAAVESVVAKARALEAGGDPATARMRDALVKAEDAYIAAERDLLLALGRSVRRADQLPAGKREQLLKELGITAGLAEAVRTGEVGQQLGAYVQALTAVKVQRALVPVGGGDFLVAGAQFDLVIEYFRTQGATVLGANTPFSPVPPGGIGTGARTAIIEVPGAPSMRILETAGVEPHSVLGSVDVLDRPFTLSARETRMRAIARLLLANRELISRPDKRAGQAAEATTALKELRTPFHAKPGDPSPPLEAYVPDFVLRENIEAIARLRARVLAENPDVILGMERYGALLADVLAYGHPQLAAKVAKFTPVGWDKGPSPSVGKKGKFDPGSTLDAFRNILGPDKQVARTIAVVDSYMGGSTTESLLQQVYRPLLAEYPNVKFRNYMIRETFGFKVPGPERPAMADVRGRPKPAESERIRFDAPEDVSMIIGDDVSVVFRVTAGEPIRVFDPSGKVVETFLPKQGQTTRDVLIELMNGKYAAAPPKQVPDPVRVPGRIPPDVDDPKLRKPPPTPVPPTPVR